MYCISINHKKTKTSVRELFVLDEKEQETILELVRTSENIDGVVLLMTCNRCECYFAGTKDAMQEMEAILLRVKKGNADIFHEMAMRYEKRKAICHLYRVVCGLDSAVLGEVEIIRQVKEAYRFAKERKAVDASLHIIFQGALNLAKEIADQSMMTKLPVSVGTLSTGAALNFCKDKEEPHILLVGATGEMGSIIRKDMADASQAVRIVGTSRMHKKDLLSFTNTEQMKWIHYDNRYEFLAWADVIISATGSPHYTMLAQKTAAYVKDNKKRLFLDLAMPRDMEEAIGELPGCTLKNMDYIRKLAKENNVKKMSEAKKVEILVEKKAEEIDKILLFRKFVGTNEEKLRELEGKSASWLLYQLKEQVDYACLTQVLECIKEEN